MHSFRAFIRDDILVDYGCGPGVTLEKVFYLNHTMRAKQQLTNSEAFENNMDPKRVPSCDDGILLGRHARICDISLSSISISRRLATVRCPLKGVWCDWMNAFEGGTALLTADFLDWLPAHIDVAYSSLTAEYLSDDQLLALSKVLLDRLEDRGLLAWFDWSEHVDYDPQDCEKRVDRRYVRF